MLEISEDSCSIPENGDNDRNDNFTAEVQQAYRIFQSFLLEKHKAVTASFWFPVGDQTANEMSLKTIDDKFVKQEYESITEFVADFRQMLENCYRFHGVDHWISKQAQKLEIILEQKLTLLSRTLREKTALVVTSKGRFGTEDEKAPVGTSTRRRSVPRNLAAISVGGSESIMVQALRLEEQQRAKEEKRQRDLEKKEAGEASAKEVDEWERSLLLLAESCPIGTMWELPAIGHFLCLAQKALNLPEIVFFELERCLLMPRCSSFLAKIMTSLLCPPHRRMTLHRRPALPYRRWEVELRQKVLGWYQSIGRAKDQEACAEHLGLCHRFFWTLGETSPLEEKPFHLLPFNQRVWLLKGLCDNVYETQKDVQDAVLGQPIHECRESILGYDSQENTYIHFPHFCGADLRIYRQSPCLPLEFPLPSFSVKKLEAEIVDKTEEILSLCPEAKAGNLESCVRDDGSEESEIDWKGPDKLEFLCKEELPSPQITVDQPMEVKQCLTLKEEDKKLYIDYEPCLRVGMNCYMGKFPANSLSTHALETSLPSEIGATVKSESSCQSRHSCPRCFMDFGANPESHACLCFIPKSDRKPSVIFLHTSLSNAETGKIQSRKKSRKKKKGKLLGVKTGTGKLGLRKLQQARGAKSPMYKSGADLKRKDKRRKQKLGRKFVPKKTQEKNKDQSLQLPAEPSFKLVCTSLEELRDLISKTEDELDELESTKKRCERWYIKREAVKELHITLIRLLNELLPWEPKLLKAFHRNSLQKSVSSGVSPARKKPAEPSSTLKGSTTSTSATTESNKCDLNQELKTVCIRDSQSILVTTRGGNTGVVKEAALNIFGKSHDSGPGCGTAKRHESSDFEMEKKYHQGTRMLSERTACALVLVFISTLWVSVYVCMKQHVIGKSTGEFNATRARNYLERITSVGPRPVGNAENEIMTVNFLLKQLEWVRSESVDGPNTITVETRKHSGSFTDEFLGNFTNCYDQITNVVVRLEPRGGAQHFVLANCHFDSVPGSPGASDDAVCCAVMLEVLHSISNLSIPLHHGVIFLFNGAEETHLLASHGFVTQHELVKQIRAFVNLEALGVGGKDLMFQTGPENPWLVQAYADAVQHPFASVMGQEIFQSGVISSYTDFHFFTNIGNIPGIDLAFIENGYLYHTKYDTPDRIPTDSIQRAGDHILALLKHLITMEMLADPSEYRNGSMVFFDVLGLTMVVYPARVGSIINYAVAFAGFIYLAKTYLWPRNVCGWHVLRGLLVFVISWFVAVAVTVLGVARVVTWMGRSMFWFTHFYASICLYGSVAAGTILLIHTLARMLFYRNKQTLELSDLFFDISLLLWCFALILLNLCGLCSAYIPMLMVFFPLATKLLLCRHFAQKGVTYILFYLLGLSLPCIHLSHLIWIVFEVFTPIMGHFGNDIPPDFVIALLIAITTALLSSFLIHLLYQASSTKHALAALCAVFVVMFVLVSCGVFFPYSGDPASPRPKRVNVQHFTCNCHALNGSLEKTDSGYWIKSFDYTGMSHITPHIPEINENTRSDELPFCGFDWLFPNTSEQDAYVPAPAVSPKSPLEFKLVSRNLEDGAVKLSFEAKGPSNMDMFIMPHPGFSLTDCSFANMTKYHIKYTHGMDAGPWTFWIEVKPPLEYLEDNGMVSIAISAHYLFGEDQQTPDLSLFLQKFPDWAFVTSRFIRNANMESDTELRRLNSSLDNVSNENSDTPKPRESSNSDEMKKNQPCACMLSEGVACALVLVFMCALVVPVYVCRKQLLTVKSPGEFNATRARKYLERITSVGPRPVGSPENEIMTVNFLLEQLEWVRNESVDGPNNITVEMHKHSGSLGIYYYDQIINIVVRLEPRGGAQHFVLANCHFDSVPGSPGANDDAVGCAVMLEVLHSISNLSIPLNHGIIFLFNGAEEIGLLASHAFVTQNELVKHIRAFVNLEACGVGGKELAFQIGPENPWLVQAYVHAVKHPFASVVGQEVFQSGSIHSDTDFRIFTEIGNIPGIDLAFIENGYLYHTKYDTPDRILTDSIQRA
ncbi:endoplasmic reticulum metallopeptidase 1, partial [Clarias magur]